MIAKTLACNGAAKVYILGRRKDILDAGAVQSGTTNIIVPIVTDVTSKESLMGAATQIASEVGFVNVLIANAGIGGPRHQFPPQTSIEEFQSALWKVEFNEYVQTFATNTAGVWFTAVAFLALLDKGNKNGNVTQSSQVISLGSVAGFNRATPGNYAYAQSKAATTHIMKQLATGLVPYGIRSNMIAPGCKFSTIFYSAPDAASLLLLSSSPCLRKKH
jgi:NAD(P)-dependent dehydrogenase (short-subunit alcohol dehydrogenase family)